MIFVIFTTFAVAGIAQMPTEIRCPNCNRKYSVSEKHIGRNVVCADSACGSRFIAVVEEIQSETQTISGTIPSNGNSETANETSVVPPGLSEHPKPDVQNENSHSALDTGRSQKQFWGLAKKVIGDASTHVSNAGVAVTSKAASLGSIGIATATEVGKQSFVAASSAIETSGAKEAIKATASAVSGKLDEVSGKRLVELLEKKLQIQDSYNDILATRLAEALERITTLENRVNTLVANSTFIPTPPSEIEK